MTEKGAKNLNPIEFFAGLYLSHDMKCVVPTFHREMYQIAYEGHKRICLIAPRSFAKSSVFAKFYPLYQILQGDKNKIYIFSSTAALAENWLREIKKELTENKFILADFGDVTTDKWTSEHIICNVRGRKVEVRARGRGAQTRGWRPDLIVLDDIDEEEVAKSEEQREKLRNWHDKELVNTLEPDGQLIMIGTKVHPLCLISEISERQGYITKFYQAYLPDGEPLWPEKWSKAQLEARRAEIGSMAFNAEFMNEPIISENPIFVKEWLNKYEPGSEAFKNEVARGLYTVIAIDPAISRKQTADYTAFIVASATYEKDPKIYIRSEGGVMRGRMPINRQVAEFDRLYRKFNANVGLIETVAYQEALYDEVKRYNEDNHRYPTIKDIKRDRDKERRAHAVASIFERGRVYFDHDDPMTRLLMDELILFPTGSHDDLVDAVVDCVTEIKKWSKRRNVMQDSQPYIVLPGKRRNPITGVV